MDHQPAQLLVDRNCRAATIVVRVTAVDVKVVAPFEELLEKAAKADLLRLEIDLSEVSFADSSIVRLALKARERVTPAGEVSIKAPDPVQRLFELTRTAQLFSIVPV